MKKLKVCALLLIVLFNLIFVSSCWTAFYTPYHLDKSCESGYGRYDNYRRLNTILVKSDENIFNINEVELDLYINLNVVSDTRDINEIKYYDLDYLIPCYNNESIVSVPYSINYLFFEYNKNENNQKVISILNEGVLLDIKPEDVIEGKYKANINKETLDYEYIYNEIIVIPKECFDKDSGEFCIGVKIDYFYSVLIYFRYHINDENIIEIDFDYENFKQSNDINSTSAACIEDIKKYYLDNHSRDC